MNISIIRLSSETLNEAEGLFELLQGKAHLIYLLILLINSILHFLDDVLEDLCLAIDILYDDAEPASPLSLLRVLREEVDPLIFRGLVLVFFKVGD